MKQITTRVDDNIAEAFYAFCDKLHLSPYDLLGAIIGFYGRAEILARRLEKNEFSPAERLIEIGNIVSDMKKFSNANGEFNKAIGAILEPYGVKINELGVMREIEKQDT
jgi:hypothetical protein